MKVVAEGFHVCCQLLVVDTQLVVYFLQPALHFPDLLERLCLLVIFIPSYHQLLRDGFLCQMVLHNATIPSLQDVLGLVAAGQYGFIDCVRFESLPELLSAPVA